MITDDNRSQYRKGEINIIHEVSIETIFIKRGRKLKQNKQTRQIFVKTKGKRWFILVENFNENINCVLILVYFMFISIGYSMDEQNR